MREKLPHGSSVEYFHKEDRVIDLKSKRKGWIQEIILDDRRFIYIAKVYLDGDNRPRYFNLNNIEKEDVYEERNKL